MEAAGTILCTTSTKRARCASSTLMAARGKSVAFARIRAEVIRLVALIPAGKFTT